MAAPRDMPTPQPRSAARASVSSRTSDLLRLYFEDIGKHALLSRDEERRLALAIEAGRAATAILATGPPVSEAQRTELQALVAEGKRAKEAFVSANLRLVVSIAKRFQPSRVPLLDLVQEGNLGLMHAVEKFDVRRGFKFSTYASWWIRQAVTRGIANTGRTIRLPVHAGATFTRVQAAQAGLEIDLGRIPTVDEVATETGLGVNKVHEALALASQPMSLFETLGSDAERVSGDIVEDPVAGAAIDQIMLASLPAQIINLLNVLDEREREVVCLRYGLVGGKPLTLAAVAEVFGLSKAGISKVERRALKKLRLSAATTGIAEVLAG